MATNPPPMFPAEPLSVAEVKNNLRVTNGADDYLIAGLIVSAREFVESKTGLVITPRTLTETARDLSRWIDLASWPVNGILEIRYPVAGVLTPLAATAWAASFKRRPVRILPRAWGWGVAAGAVGLRYRLPTLPVEIDVDAGYANPADVPSMATRAMHLMIGSWYSNRSAVESGVRAAAIEIPLGATELMRRLKMERI